MIIMQEPIRWQNILLFLNEYMKYHNFLLSTIPLTADMFVFFYPIFLIVLYVVWLKQNKNSYKESSLWIFYSWIFSIILNIIIQFICNKIRPNILLWLDYEKVETILHKFLPQSSFPSDHSAISMGIAIWTILWWIRNKDKKFIWIWIIFVIFALIMWFSRVMIWVHWPTDVIAWFVVWVLVPIILFQKNIYAILKKLLIIMVLNSNLVTNGHKKMALVTIFCLEIDFKKVKGNARIFCK